MTETSNLSKAPLRFAELPDVRLAYTLTGEGPPLVLIHGAEADHAMFNGLAARLGTDFTVIAYDQRDSGATENGTEPYGLSELGDDAAALIKHLGLARAHVFGTSLGGAIAQALASRHPSVVDRLVLGSTWRVGRSVLEFNPQAAQSLGKLRADLQANAAEVAAYFYTTEFLQAHPQAVDLFRKSTRSDAQKARRAHMQANPPILSFADIQAPTLLLAGGADRLIPADATFELASHIAHAQSALMPGLVHVGVIESPDVVASHVRTFLVG